MICPPSFSRKAHTPMTDSPLGAAIVPVTPLQQNCSLLWCTSSMQAAVVDPGGDMDHLLANIDAHGLKVVKILVTHAHVDHAGAAAAMSEKLGVPIIGPQKEDQFWIDQIEAAGQQYGLPQARAFTPSRWLDDGDSVSLGETEFDVYHCPGHTPGHVVFHNVDAGLAAVGDVLFQGSIGRSDFPRGDMAILVHSITNKLWPLGDNVTFIPGHGALSTFGQERQTNPFVADHILNQS